MANFQDCPHSDRKKQRYRLLELRFEVQTISHNEMAEEVKESLPELSADTIPDTNSSEAKEAKSASSSMFAKPKNSSSKSLVENNSKQAKQAEATEDGNQPSTKKVKRTKHKVGWDPTFWSNFPGSRSIVQMILV